MYEEITYEKILNRMLDRVPNTVDKREGSLIYDALAPAALELKLLYIEAETILRQTFAVTADREYLIKRAAERGLAPYQASKAVIKGSFNVDVPLGSRFLLGKWTYCVKERLADGVFTLECEAAGREPNGCVGKLVPVNYIEGLQRAEATEILIPGEEEEDTEAFRKRYLSSLNSQAYGGNIQDYKEKVIAIPGVGGVKVYPVYYGGGTVRLSIINAEFETPSTELVNRVQTEVDPVANHGEGLGLAPIGHTVTVVGVKEQAIDIAFSISYLEGFSWEQVQPGVIGVIDTYFQELKKSWADTSHLIIRISQIETRILALSGVLDISKTTINGKEENLVLDADFIPARGRVNE